ncbi:unnamed protein product [Leptidea sinapis]|uniref:EF-hand domain-containing protein n=1 Tax=Leptidea sinapis TaxID=189913 RepID=A0A5E4R295_9NEOP|nr:unnamed protein product [Leptidea sinapis]
MFHVPAKPLHTSNIAMHRPQSASSRVDDELMQKSHRALNNTSDPLDRLRLMCLSRGSGGIMGLASKQLNKEEFVSGIKESGLDLNPDDTEELFHKFDVDNSGSISLDEFIARLRPPMSESRRAIVEQAFKKLDKTGDGVLTIDDIRKIYSFLANFEGEGSVDGTVTLEEFMNYYSAISVSIDNDCYFDLMMRQAYKL